MHVVLKKTLLPLQLSLFGPDLHFPSPPLPLRGLLQVRGLRLIHLLSAALREKQVHTFHLDLWGKGSLWREEGRRVREENE